MTTVPGRMGAVKPAGAAYTTLVQPVTNIVVGYVLFANQSATTDTIRVSVTQNAASNPTPSAGDFISYGANVNGTPDANFADHGSVGPITLNPANNDQIVVYSVNGTTSFVFTGDAGAT